MEGFGAMLWAVAGVGVVVLASTVIYLVVRKYYAARLVWVDTVTDSDDTVWVQWCDGSGQHVLKLVEGAPRG